MCNIKQRMLYIYIVLLRLTTPVSSGCMRRLICIYKYSKGSVIKK